MPNQGYIIPRDINGETAYVHSTDNYLRVVVVPSNGMRLGLIPEEIDEWHNLRLARDLIIAAIESPITKTALKETELAENGSDFIDFATPIINRMRVSLAATSTDAAVFHFTIGRANPTHKVVAIAEAALGKSNCIGGGIVKIPCHLKDKTCYIPHELGAEAVEIAYILGDAVITDPNAGTTKVESKRSRVVLNLDPATRGKKITYFIRWINISFPNLNGPWSGPQDDIIL